MRKFVIYRDSILWSHAQWCGAAEYHIGRWPFRKVQHAPVIHKPTEIQTFEWLRHEYPNAIIEFNEGLHWPENE